MVDEFTERLLNDFVFADCRLGSHPVVRALTSWLESGSHLVVGESAPRTRITTGMRIPLDGLGGAALRRRTNVAVADVRQSPGEYLAFEIQGAVRSSLAAPMLDGDRAVGVLMLDSTHPGFFNERHAAAASLLAAVLIFARWHIRDRRSSPASESLGKLLRSVRMSLGLTQDALANRLETSRIALSRQESGAQLPTRNRLLKWLGALELIDTKSTPTVHLIEITDRVSDLVLPSPEDVARLTPDQFQRFVAGRLDRMGYDTTLTGHVMAKDGGIDLIAVPKIRTVGAFLLAAQIKHHVGSTRTGREAVDRLLAWKDSYFRLTLLVTNTEFTRDARWVAERDRHKPFVRLRDFEDLKRWIKDDFDSEHDWREIPSEIELAPGLVVRVPAPGPPESGLPFSRRESEVGWWIDPKRQK